MQALMTEELAECLPPLYATEGGALALDLTNPEGEDHLDLWCSLTINLSGDPFASTWRIHTCARHHGHGVAKSADGRKPLLTQRSTR